VGYRELLKKYILHLQITAGDHFIESETAEPVLSDRDLGELKTLAAEIHRGTYDRADRTRAENYNARLRILMNQHGLSAEALAALCHIEVGIVNCWRTSPRSARYQPITEAQFACVERAVLNWLESTSD
jgi:hypothetical protein